MRFGFGRIPEDVESSSELVRIAEDLGYDFAWVPDQQLFRDPYVCLGAMAAKTATIRLGVGVTNPFTRHPAMAARAIATVDEVARGRAALGIGAGNMKELLQPLRLDTSAVAAKCLDMAVVVKKLLGGEPVHHDGRHFPVDGIGMDFRPRPDIPVYLAGRGPKILEAAGEVGDGAIIGGLVSEAGIAYAMERIGAGAARGKRDISQLDIVSWVTVHVTDDVPAAMDRLRPTVGHIMGGAPVEVLQGLGFDSGFIGRLKEAYQQGGPKGAAPLVTDEAIRCFTVVGSPATVAETVDVLAARGVTQLSLLMPPGSFDDHKRILRRFAEEVRPRLRSRKGGA